MLHPQGLQERVTVQNFQFAIDFSEAYGEPPIPINLRSILQDL